MNTYIFKYLYIYIGYLYNYIYFSNSIYIYMTKFIWWYFRQNEDLVPRRVEPPSKKQKTTAHEVPWKNAYGDWLLLAFWPSWPPHTYVRYIYIHPSEINQQWGIMKEITMAMRQLRWTMMKCNSLRRAHPKLKIPWNLGHVFFLVFIYIYNGIENI